MRSPTQESKCTLDNVSNHTFLKGFKGQQSTSELSGIVGLQKPKQNPFEKQRENSNKSHQHLLNNDFSNQVIDTKKSYKELNAQIPTHIRVRRPVNLPKEQITTHITLESPQLMSTAMQWMPSKQIKIEFQGKKQPISHQLSSVASKSNLKQNPHPRINSQNYTSKMNIQRGIQFSPVTRNLNPIFQYPHGRCTEKAENHLNQFVINLDHHKLRQSLPKSNLQAKNLKAYQNFTP